MSRARASIHCRSAGPALAAMALIAGAVVTALRAGHIGDYAIVSHIPDNPAPTIEALLHGHLARGAALQPVMGLGSIILRLPFVALAAAVHGGETLSYRLGTIPCVLAVGLFALAVGTVARERGRAPWVGPAACLVLVLNPVSQATIWWGHPEELLGGALCAGAVLAAMRDRPRLAGALLGVALGTKEWALLAVVPALIAARREQRRELAVVSGAVALPLVGLLPALDPAAFLSTGRAIGNLRMVSFSSLWWPVAATKIITTHVSGALASAELHTLPLGLTRAQVSWLAPAASLPLGLAVSRRAGSAERTHALGLLALLLLLRAALDPISMLYYCAPFVIALLGWELVTGAGMPRVSLLAIVGLWWSIDANSLSAQGRAAVFVAITGVLALAIAQPLLRGEAPRRVLRAPLEPVSA